MSWDTRWHIIPSCTNTVTNAVSAFTVVVDVKTSNRIHGQRLGTHGGTYCCLPSCTNTVTNAVSASTVVVDVETSNRIHGRRLGKRGGAYFRPRRKDARRRKRLRSKGEGLNSEDLECGRGGG